MKQGQSYMFESSTTLLVPYAWFHIFFKLLNDLHILGIIVVFHLIYKPFIFVIYFQILNHLLAKENNLHLLPLWWQNWKRKHWKLNVTIKGIYFFFCIYDNLPWHLFLCRFFVFFGWTLACHFLDRVQKIFSLSRWRERKRFFTPLQEFCSSFQNREEPLTHFEKRFCLLLALQKVTMVFKTL